ncbi:MAG TPA: hypothetical protein VF479_02360, partial [Pseudolysinimonas sp.]
MKPGLPVRRRVSEYDGESTLAVAPTQQDLPSRQAARVLDEWIEFFQEGPHRFDELEFRSRTPARLVDALAKQTQLRRLELKWGDYSDLGALAGMSELRELALGGGVRIVTLEPLAGLSSLRRLVI